MFFLLLAAWRVHTHCLRVWCDRGTRSRRGNYKLQQRLKESLKTLWDPGAAVSFVALANDPILGTQCNVPAKTDAEKTGGSEHCSEQSTFLLLLLLLLLLFNINIATVHQQTTGDLKNSSSRSLRRSLQWGWVACPYTVKDHPLTGERGVVGGEKEENEKKKCKGQMCVCADGAAVCLESLLVRGTAIIGGA